MFASKLQKLGADGCRHHQTTVLDALSPSQQVGRQQRVEHVAPLLFLLGCIVVLAASLETVELLIVVVGDLLSAFAGKNLLAGAD